ncbi:MAG: hypothetical protein JW869_05135 [Candidatus Omnitrophica bacterium]|nr:hypothetical protein [Candidatus Omnitrophota bacterium]
MAKKQKFNPQITRVKLNPEQAVLACACYNSGYDGAGDSHPAQQGCDISGAKVNNYFNTQAGAVSS